MNVSLPKTTSEGLAAFASAVGAIVSETVGSHALAASTQDAIVAAAGVVVALYVHGRTKSRSAAATVAPKAADVASELASKLRQG